MAMMSKSQKKKGSKQKKNVGNKQRNRVRIMRDDTAAKWARLLVDPCMSDLAYPCYGGTDAGYLIRTVENQTLITGGSFSVGQKVVIDGMFSWSPWNLSTTTGNLYGFSLAGNALSIGPTGQNNFITSSVVKGYRPVAACLKFIPTGAIGDRSGEVALGYAPGALSAGSAGIGYYVAMSQRKASNGAEHHEINWLPTLQDEIFTTVGAPNNAGCGTVFIALRNVDGIAGTTSTAAVSGYMEITTVWEWTPAIQQGITMDPRTPSPYNSQTVLAGFGDIKNALFSRAHQSAIGLAGNIGSGAVRMLGGAAGAAANLAMEYASRTFMGTSNLPGRYRGTAMPLLM